MSANSNEQMETKKGMYSSVLSPPSCAINGGLLIYERCLAVFLSGLDESRPWAVNGYRPAYFHVGRGRARPHQAGSREDVAHVHERLQEFFDRYRHTVIEALIQFEPKFHAGLGFALGLHSFGQGLDSQVAHHPHQSSQHLLA